MGILRVPVPLAQPLRWTQHRALCLLHGVYSRVSDETMGGTYMTLLNTVSNLGFKWCETAAMFAVDLASPKRCEGGDPRRERRARRRRQRTSASRAADDASTATGRSTCSWGCRRSSRTSGSRSPPSTWTDCRREGWPSGKCGKEPGAVNEPRSPPDDTVLLSPCEHAFFFGCITIHAERTYRHLVVCACRSARRVASRRSITRRLRGPNARRTGRTWRVSRRLSAPRRLC